MAEKMDFLPRKDILSLEECLKVAQVFVAFGVNKIRLTGGEPLVRKNLPWLARRISEIPGLRELVLTTNGSQLSQFAQPLAQAGVHRINISLDSLHADTFQKITRTGDLQKVLGGVDAAIDAFGATNVKINTVMLRDTNHLEFPVLVQFALDRKVNLSFIEQMPLGESGHDYTHSFYSSQDALAQLKQHYEMTPCSEISGLDNTDGPARYWQVKEHATRIGFISPHSHNFCGSCNRMRVTARGELFPCLGNEGMVDLLPALRAENNSNLHRLILQATAEKPLAHEFDIQQRKPRIIRFMSRTGG